jgi:predicted Rossmann-fold nucleotide-binding protein
VVLYGSKYWHDVLNLDILVDKGTISPRDRELFQVADTTDQAFEILRDGLMRNHLEPELAKDAELPDIAQTRR